MNFKFLKEKKKIKEITVLGSLQKPQLWREHHNN